MRAVVCEAYGPVESLVFREVPDPTPGPGEVLVGVRAAGISYADALLVQGKYQAKPELPFVPGSEFSGEVLEVGPEVTGFRPGERVMGTSGTYGAFAERLRVAPRVLMPVPDWVDDEQAASLLYGHGTAHHALLQRARLQPGESLLVLGAAGGVGIPAVQIGKAMGARVLAACSSPEKAELARQNGADVVIDYARDDLRTVVKDLTGGRGVDVVYDPVGGDLFDACTRVMARNGRLLVIGFASGRIPQFPVNLALVKEYAVVGVFWGNFARNEPDVFAQNMRQLFQWHREGKVHVEITERVGLEQVPATLSRILNRGVMGKVIVRPT